MKPLLFLTADYANITRDGKLNVMGIFNDVFSYNFPTRHPSIYLVGKLGAELEEYGQIRHFTIKLLDEDTNQIMDVAGQFVIPKSESSRRPEVNLILELKDVVFPKAGVYQFVLLIEKNRECELSLYVNQIEAPNWKMADLESLYEGFGFIIKHGQNHDIVKHPNFPHLRSTLPRHIQLAKGHVEYAVKLVDKLSELQKQSEG